MSEYRKVKLGDIFTLEKGSLQSSKCTPGQYDFITAAEDWKTHESYTHDCEAIVYAVAASGSLGRAHYVNGKFIASDLCFIMQEKDKEKYPVNFQFYQIIFEVLRDEIVSKTKTGTSKESISQKNLSKYEIPYFDYDFQIANYERLVRTKQIIAKISKETESQKAYAKQLRQNILQDAIESQSNIRIYRIENLLVNDRKGMMTGPFGTLISKNDHKSFGIPMLGIENIGKGKFIKGNKIFVTKEKANELKNYSVRANDIIISRSGTVGEICSIPQEYENALISTNLIKITLNQSIIYSDYFVLLFQCKGIIIDQVKKICSGSTRLFLTQGILKQISFPVPSLEIQLGILNKVDKIFEKIMIIEQQISQREEYANQLMQSILKDAFEER